MELSDKVRDKRFIDYVMPEGLNLSGKICYLTAQVNANMLPFSGMYMLLYPDSDVGSTVFLINAGLFVGGIIGLVTSQITKNNSPTNDVQNYTNVDD